MAQRTSAKYQLFESKEVLTARFTIYDPKTKETTVIDRTLVKDTDDNYVSGTLVSKGTEFDPNKVIGCVRRVN